jgi:hypothetical protein
MSPQPLESPAAMGGARKLSVLLTAALCAALLAACGGGGGDSSATTSADQTTASGTTTGATGESGSTQSGKSAGQSAGKGSANGSNGSGGANGSGSGESGGGSGSGSGGGSSSGGSSGSGGGNSGVAASFHFAGKPIKHHHPTPVEGQRSETFVVPGGDNSIQEYGTEQGSEERIAAMQPIAALYRAFATSDWTEVCNTYLSAGNVEQITQLAEKSPTLKGKSCAAILNGLNQGRPSEITPDTPDGGIVSFRTEGGTGFAIYWGIDGKGYAFALKSEGGAWKLTSLAPTPLTP